MLNDAHEGATAADFPTQDDDCGNNPDEDGWHFIAPANANFTTLTVTFELEDGSQTSFTLDDPSEFGPPDPSHAFVQTPAGATLLSGSATVAEDINQDFFNLSHTCPASTTPTPSDTSRPTPSDASTPTSPGDDETTPGDEDTSPDDGAVLPKTGAGFPVEGAALVGLFLLLAGAALIKWRDELLVLYRRRH